MKRSCFLLVAIGLVGCSSESEVTSSDSTRLGSGDGGAPGSALTSIRSTVPACPDDFSKTENCINAEKPPVPSIRRSHVRPRGQSNDRNATNTDKTKNFDARKAQSGQTLQLPPHRTSMDGRIATAEHSLTYLTPENVGVGFVAYADPERRFVRADVNVHDVLRFDARPGKHRFPQAQLDSWMSQTPAPGGNAATQVSTINWDLCKEGDAQGTSEPRACRAQATPGGPFIDGECYNLTLIHSVDSEYKWELRSLALTVFAGGGKRVVSSNQTQNELPVELWMYPRSAAANFPDLPPKSEYAIAPGIADPNSGPAAMTAALSACKQASAPKWCAYLDDQKVLLPPENYVFYTQPGVSHSWNGVQNGNDGGINKSHSFLEPATTADGRVLFTQDYAQGLMYSYNALGPCDARGFREFKPISMAYTDPLVNSTYGFAKYPIRDTQGTPYPPGAKVTGGYPWVDHKGNNLMFPAGGAQNGYNATWVQNPGETWSEHGKPTAEYQINKGNGVAVVVVGSWTRGKMIVVDNGLNQTDWSFALNDSAGYRNRRFAVDLFENSPPTNIRPAGTALVNSLENALNGYEAFNPLSPFDVVWTASSTTVRNAEVVFDEYLRKGAWVVAHMNAPLYKIPAEETPQDLGDHWTYENGFTMDPVTRLHVFKRTPKLQNAATRDAAPTLELRGGAFPLPVAEGGAIGRGIFLDGKNDHVLVKKMPPRLPRFLLGLWVDSRSENNDSRVLYTFGDKSKVLWRKGMLTFRAKSGTQRTFAISDTATANGRYVHLGLEFGTAPFTPRADDMEAAEAEALPGGGVGEARGGGPILASRPGRKVTVYIDGTPVGSVVTPWLADFAELPLPSEANESCAGLSQGLHCMDHQTRAVFCKHGAPLYPMTTCSPSLCQTDTQSCGGPAIEGTMAVGATEGSIKPVRAWIDELRVYELEQEELTTSTTKEFVCNLALGSQRIPAGQTQPVCEQMDFRHDEVVDTEGVGTGTDFAREAYLNANCGSTVHRSALAGCVRGEALGIADKNIVPNKPRPDFRSVAFCTSCHTTFADPVPGLRSKALDPGSFHADGTPYLDDPSPSKWARIDPRRQPMFFYPKLWGGPPKRKNSVLLPFTSAWSDGSLDDLLLGTTPQMPPKRIMPFASLPN
ncbi:MAG: hypothetical protein U0174_28495 [Polyangiaceae bacterium]